MSCEIGRILQFKEAMVYQKIILTNNKNEDITKTCKFSWSIDSVCWTEWADLNSYNRICQNLETDFYLRILFYSDLKSVYLNNVTTNCYNITLDTTNIFLKDFCSNPNLFQPYNNLDCALQLQQQLSDSIICMFGIPVYYFRVDVNKSSADYTFKEYFLHDVVDVKQIKLMIQDGQMPSSNYRITEFDFDWENDWETEISKTQFATAFGDTVFPKTQDFIYIPMMKRMWQVNAAYDEKNEGLMWRSTTWKLTLVKYNDSTNVNSEKFDNIIDNFIVNTYDNTFGELETNEQHRLTGADPLSSPQYASTNLYDVRMYDAVRKQCAGNVNISEMDICHNNKVTGKNIYNLGKNSFVVYQKEICGDSGTLMFIFNNIFEYNRPIDIIEFGNVKVKIKDVNKEKSIIYFNNVKQEIEKNNIYMIICRWNKSTMTSDLSIYIRKHRDGIPLYKLRPESYWFDFENPICEINDIYNEDFNISSPQCCMICGPSSLTNIKYYNKYLSKKDLLTESIKYVTTHESCIINDLARPITSGYGYSIQ